MGRKILGRIKKALREKITEAEKIIFFLDYDGTITPIRKRPALATLEKNTKTLLKNLAEKSRVKIFITSGRILSDVKKRVGLGSLYYIGNHGIELEGKGLRYVHPVTKAVRPSIKNCYDILKKKLRLKGIILENKIYTLSVHYRLVPARFIPRLFDVFRRTVKELRENIPPSAGSRHGKKIKITKGKKVFEVRPDIKCDKGTAVTWVLKREKTKKYLPISIGDDRTDEDAFRAVGKRGVTILVSRSPRKTFAEYRLDSPRQVIDFLEWINGLVDKKNKKPL